VNVLDRAHLIVVTLALGVRMAAAADLTVEGRDARGNIVADAALYAEPVAGNAPAARANAQVSIDQVNKEFVPRVTIVQAGTEVSFPNSDNIRHSIYSFSPAKTFTTKLYAGREAAPVLFDKAGLVVLGCNIHDNMVAWVYIVDTPWFGKSAADGTGVIRNLPAGDYHITAAAAATAAPVSTTIEMRVEEGQTLRRTIVLGAEL